MTIVTLTTDFGHKDFSISVIKAALLQEIPNLKIVDISHEISPYNASETAYILKNAFRAFPKGSIHIIGVESEWTPENIHLVMEFEEHYFIGADNGILSMIKEDFIYIDNYGNLVSNIKKDLFYEIGKSRNFTIYARSVKFKKIYKNYSEAIDFSLPKGKREEDGKKLAIFNTSDHLELAVYKSNPLTIGGAGSLFGLDYRDPITVKFE